MTNIYIALATVYTNRNESNHFWNYFVQDNSGFLYTISQNDELIRGTVVVFRKVRQYYVGVDRGGISLVVG